MTSRYPIVTNTATQTETIVITVSESPILAWYQASIGDSDTIVTAYSYPQYVTQSHLIQLSRRKQTA